MAATAHAGGTPGYARHPQRVTEAGLVHLDFEPGAEPALAATGEEDT